MREIGWKSLLDDVSSFCDSHAILIPKLDESYFFEKSKRKSPSVCYSHNLHIEAFLVVINVNFKILMIILMLWILICFLGWVAWIRPIFSLTLTMIEPKLYWSVIQVNLIMDRFEIWVTNSIHLLFICKVVIPSSPTCNEFVTKGWGKSCKLTLILFVPISVERTFSSMKHIKMKYELALVINI